ncbi:uncharacterized protein JCM15063_005294 [Sporobolomyces koalae]|uniref:uncharacterized protein n=1 Tax=Sporobolomyces koalae TaxID=500713 RepID=UPI00316D060B
MSSRAMLRSVSAPAADLAPPTAVALTLRSNAFKSLTTRRDLSTSYRAFKAAWTTVEQMQVLSTSCRRVAERAAEVLNAVRDKLEAVETSERDRTKGTVVVERSYEFQGEATMTIFKIQAAMLDLQAFAVDHLAVSTSNRLALLVEGLPKTITSLDKLSASLASCISTYSLAATISTVRWSEENDANLAKDQMALHRLFQLSIVLRGPLYDRFIKQRMDTMPPLASETPGQRRIAFVEWCLEQNPTLRPSSEQPLVSATHEPTKLRAAVPQQTIGLGLPSSISSTPHSNAASTGMRRAATQPAAFTFKAVSNTSKVEAPRDIAINTVESVANMSEDDKKSVKAIAERTADSTAPAASIVDSAPTRSSVNLPQEATIDVVKPLAMPVMLSLKGQSDSAQVTDAKDDADNPTSHALDRSVSSTQSSMGMTTSSSMDSILFEPSLIPFENDESVELDSIGTEQEGPESDSELERSAGGDSAAAEAIKRQENKSPVQEPVTVESSEPPSAAADGELEMGSELTALGIALGTPLPVSPTFESPPTPRSVNTSSAPIPILPLKENLPPVDQPKLESSTTELLAPFVPTISPSLSQSPQLVVTSFDEDVAYEPDIAPSLPPKPRAYRILSLDGGGLVGAIPQLLALDNYLASLDTTLSPCRHFDLIVGTSSSALPALLLGSLGLSIQDTLKVCTQVSRQALGLDGPSSSSASPIQAKPKRVGRWARFFSRSNRTTRIQVPDRCASLDAALKQYISSAMAPLPLARSPCRVAILAFKRFSSTSRAEECWLTPESNLSLAEIVQASIALSTASSSPYVASPTSLNPASAAISYAQSLQPPDTHSIEVVSLSIGYSLSTVPTVDAKRTSRGRLEALRQIKQIGAGNSAASEALSKRLERNSDANVTLVRVDAAFDASGLSQRDEIDLVDKWETSSLGHQTTSIKQRSDASQQLSPPSSPASFKSQPSMSSPRQQSSPRRFFGMQSTQRSASAYDVSHSLEDTLETISPPTSPFSTRSVLLHRFDEYEDDLEVEDARHLRSSISLSALRSSTAISGQPYSLATRQSLSDLRNP